MSHENFSIRHEPASGQEQLQEKLLADSHQADRHIQAYINSGISRFDGREGGSRAQAEDRSDVERTSCRSGGHSRYSAASHFGGGRSGGAPFSHYGGNNHFGGGQILNNLAMVGIGYALNRGLGGGRCGNYSYNPYDRRPGYDRYDYNRGGSCNPDYSQYDRRPSYDRYDYNRSGSFDSDLECEQYLQRRFNGNSGFIPSRQPADRYRNNGNDCDSGSCSCNGCGCSNCSRSTERERNYRGTSYEDRQYSPEQGLRDPYGNWGNDDGAGANSQLPPRYRFIPPGQENNGGRNWDNGRSEQENSARQYRQQWWSGRQSPQSGRRYEQPGPPPPQYRQQWQERRGQRPVLEQLQRTIDGIIRY